MMGYRPADPAARFAWQQWSIWREVTAMIAALLIIAALGAIIFRWAL